MILREGRRGEERAEEKKERGGCQLLEVQENQKSKVQGAWGCRSTCRLDMCVF